MKKMRVVQFNQHGTFVKFSIFQPFSLHVEDVKRDFYCHYYIENISNGCFKLAHYKSF